MNSTKKQFQKEEKENLKKITELKAKLGIKEEKKIHKKTILKSKKSNKLRAKKVEKKEVHYMVTCDGCQMNPLVGKRYKCQKCPNFDFCEACYLKEQKKHNHPFKVVETKQLLKEILDKVAHKPENEEGKAVHHMYSCNGCGMHPIIGARYKCSICDDFDYCENCEAIYKHEHNHPFIKIYKPNMDPLIIKCSLNKEESK